MEVFKIVKLETSTKILFSLFNFFAPISFMCIAICSLDTFNILGTLFLLLSILVGLICLIFNIAKYNRFLHITNKTISICKGNHKRPQIIKIIDIEKILPKEISSDLSIRYENKKIKLLQTSCSIIGIICYVGPLVILPILKNKNVTLHKLVELYQIFPELFTQVPKLPSKGEEVFLNIIIWGFIAFVSIIGSFGILITPFLPFMG